MSRRTKANTMICPPTRRNVRRSALGLVLILDVPFRLTRISPIVPASTSTLAPSSGFPRASASKMTIRPMA
jgi:hypothetical protein